MTPLAPSLHRFELSPTLLAADHSAFGAGAAWVKAQGCTWLHLDIMDGHFVPNLSFGPGVVAALRPQTDLFFDTHLMLSQPHAYIEAFAKAGAQLITVHVESESPLSATLEGIRKLGCQCGIALNPSTPYTAIVPYLAEVDLVLVMTVQPGFGGQAFNPAPLTKLRALHQLRLEHGYRYRLEVDGGINEETARQCAEQGADTFVAGTAFFKSPCPGEFLRRCCTPTHTG